MDRLISAAISLRSSDDNSERKEDDKESSSSNPLPHEASDVNSAFKKRTEESCSDDDDFRFFENSRRMLSSTFSITNKIGSRIIKHEVSEVKKRLFNIMSNPSLQENCKHTVEGNDSSHEEYCYVENSNKRRKVNSAPAQQKQRMTMSSHTDTDHTNEIDQNQPKNQDPHDDDDETTISSCTTTDSSLHNGAEINGSSNIDDRTAAHIVFSEEQLQFEKQQVILYQKAYRMKRMSMMFRMLPLLQQMLLDELQTCTEEKELLSVWP